MELTTIAQVRMPHLFFRKLPNQYRPTPDEANVDGVRVAPCDGQSIIITFTPYAPNKWVAQSPLQEDPGFTGA